LIQQRIILRCLFDSRRGNYDIAAMIGDFSAKLRKVWMFFDSWEQKIGFQGKAVD
jgi:hypothetical protein